MNIPFPGRSLSLLLAILAVLAVRAAAAQPDVGTSPWGPADEIGRLNLMTGASRAAILSRVEGGRAYDLSVEYYVGMPSWYGIGDPRYQFWLTHTPRGTAVDDPMHVGEAQNRHVSYTGSAVSMYTHMGTHIDALNHFGLNGTIWNGFRADEHLGDRGWRKTGAQQGAPIVERAFLEELSRDRVHEFAFVAGSLKFRGADAAPLRPIAFPVRAERSLP